MPATYEILVGPLRGQSAVARRNREVILVAPLLSRRRSKRKMYSHLRARNNRIPLALLSGPILRFAGRQARLFSE